MKKLILSLSVIFLFAIYSQFQRQSVLGVNTIAQTPPPPTPASGGTAPPTGNTGNYKDGTYTGSVADAFYGNVQVQAVVQNGKISSVQFLQYPSDRARSLMISGYATPQLQQEAIQTQSANVDIVSGATDTSQAFISSLTSALNQAQ
jgi:uncharacterized protein with FMN-binding domain